MQIKKTQEEKYQLDLSRAELNTLHHALGNVDITDPKFEKAVRKLYDAIDPLIPKDKFDEPEITYVTVIEPKKIKKSMGEWTDMGIERPTGWYHDRTCAVWDKTLSGIGGATIAVWDKFDYSWKPVIKGQYTPQQVTHWCKHIIDPNENRS